MAIIDIGQLEQNLSDLPKKIRDQEWIVVEKEKELEEAKLEYDVDYGTVLISVRKPNATEKKAAAIVQSQMTAQKLIEARYNAKKEEASLHYLENKFIALRKIGGIEEKLMNAPVPHIDEKSF